MRKIAVLVLVLGGLSLILGIVSRFTMTPVPIVKGGLEAETFLLFTNTCVLASIALILLEKK